ncbi:MAG: hypothetical protein KUG70_14765 [Rhodobacteraceae bacterium]|nr:hypothetical protein [Paracoccaceae bacterium]
MKITATLTNGTAKIAAERLNITTDITINDAADLADHLSRFITHPYAGERITDTYSIVPNDTGVRIINPTGAFDLPWRHIASTVAQLSA